VILPAPAVVNKLDFNCCSRPLALFYNRAHDLEGSLLAGHLSEKCISFFTAAAAVQAPRKKSPQEYIALERNYIIAKVPLCRFSEFSGSRSMLFSKGKFYASTSIILQLLLRVYNVYASYLMFGLRVVPLGHSAPALITQKKRRQHTQSNCTCTCKLLIRYNVSAHLLIHH
jgi:hypothetical protein